MPAVPSLVNAVDRLVGYFSPARGLARYFDRRRLERAYEAASPRDTWKPRRAGASANADHLADAAAVRTKARALVQNVPYIRAGLDALVSATIGTGIMPRATGAQADRINALLAEWAPVCDADGRLDYYGLQAAAYRAMEQDGEVLLRLRPRRPSDNLPVPLQLQLLEVDWLDSSRIQSFGSNQVINGIEYDPLGAVAAYWLWDQHPGDVNLSRGMRTQSRRIEAANIIHLYTSERPGQGRGFSRLAPVIARVRDLQLYEDAELARKNLEARLGVLYSGDATQLANPAAEGQSVDTQAAKQGALGELPSGGITQLPTGSNVTVVEPKPAPGYVDYLRYNLHLIAAGFGITYEMMTGDVSEANFSSARVRLLDFRRGVTQMQWLVLKPRLLDRIHRAFIDAALLGGRLARPEYLVDYSMPKFDYVNPEQDVKSDIAEISVGLSSLSEKLRQRGYNPQDVFDEIKKDFDELRGLGILDVLLFKEKGKLPGDAAAQGSADATQRTLDALAQVLVRMDTRLASLEQRSTVVNVPERSVTVEAAQHHINVEPAQVRVEPTPVHNEIRVDAPIVNVPAAAAPTVNVTAQAAPAQVRVVNEVQPAKVELTLAPRTTVTEVERDKKTDRITRTIQRES